MDSWLVGFDIDGTLTKVRSSWQFAHEFLGTWQKAETYQSMHSKGLITFSQWADLDVSLWRGLPSSVFREMMDQIPLMDDAKMAVERLKREGFVVGTISAGVPSISDRLKEELEMDFAKSHLFQFEGGHLEGIKTLVTPMNKHLHLQDVAKSFSTGLERVAAIGDHWVDSKMLEVAGLGIAFNTDDEKVLEAARVVIPGDKLQVVVDEVLRWRNNR